MANFNDILLDVSKSLDSKKHSIFQEWKKQVRDDTEIESYGNMTEEDFENNIYELLEVIVQAVEKSDQFTYEEISRLTLSHTEIRAKHDYSVAEITREYQLLKICIFSAIEPELDPLSGKDCRKIIRQIDAVLDATIARSFNNFFEQRSLTFEEVRKELNATNKQLNRLLEINRDRFSYLAHDLKTPLNSIMGYAQLLLRKQQKIEEDSNRHDINNQDLKNIKQVLSSSRQLLRMVNDLLEVFSYEKGEIQLRLTSFNIRAIINSTIETLQPLAEKKGLKVSTDYENAPMKITNDIARMMKIVSNLLSNAIRYTEEGEIIIRAEMLTDDKWLLTVKDTGRGIAEEDQERIFQPFMRASSKEVKEGSTGLGLAIVKGLVKLLQGELELVSELAQGSSFKVTLPLEVVATENTDE